MPLRTIARCLRGIAFMLASSSAAIARRNVTYSPGRSTQPSSAAGASRKRNSSAGTPSRARSPAACSERAATTAASAPSGPP